MNGGISRVDGYWVQTVTPEGFNALKSYVAHQREHHGRGDVSTIWEMPAD